MLALKEVEGQLEKIKVLESQVLSDKEQAESIERQESVLIKEQSAKLQEVSGLLDIVVIYDHSLHQALEEINRLNLKIKEIEKQENKR